MKGKDGKEYRLTIKQQNFIDRYLENGGNATEAYKHAYNSNSLSENGVTVNAHKVLYNTNVQLRLDEIKARNARKLDITLASLTAQMLEATEMAKSQGKSGEYGLNVERLAKLTGNWVDKQEVKHDGPSPEAWLADYKKDLEERQSGEDAGPVH